VNFEFRPQKINLFVGDNGSGKTSVFDVLRGIQDMVTLGRNVHEAFPASSVTRWETRRVQRFELDLEGGAGVYKYTLEVDHEGHRGTASIRTEEVHFEGQPLYASGVGPDGSFVQLYRDDASPGARFAFRPRQSFLAVLESRPENRKLTWFKQFLSDIWLLKLNPGSMKAATEQEEGWLSRDGSNFASWYRQLALERPEVVDSIKDELKEIIDGFQAIRFIGAGGEARELRVMCARGSGDSRKTYELGLEELSEGQRILLVLYAVLHAARGSARVLCFDEPDNFVALREIQPWLIKLGDAIEDGDGQALLISHHPEVIDYLAADSAFLFERPRGELVRVRPLEVPREEGLKASELLARGWVDEQA
jgi:predicted ATPase